MISKNQIKFINSLHLKKIRERENLFIAEGEKIVNELLISGLKIHSVFGLPGWKEVNKSHVTQLDFFEITDDELKKISLLEKPNKVLALAQFPSKEFFPGNFNNEFTLMLNDVQDPGNMGTIIRTADWFGIKNIICSNETVDAFNPKVVQASMGSVFRINVFYENLKNVLARLKNESPLTVYAATLDGKNCTALNLKMNSILIMGNESKGINAELLSFADEKISIPKSGSAAVESLNVGLATAVLCYEFRRKEY